MSGLSDLFGVGKQVLKGPYAPDLNDPNYSHHHRMVEAQPGEQLIGYTGVHRPNSGGFFRQGVGIRVSDKNIYIDPLDVQAVGSVAKLVRLGLRGGGVKPLVAPLEKVAQSGDEKSGYIFTLPNELGGGVVQTIPGADMRRPGKISPLDQLRQSLRLARGK